MKTCGITDYTNRHSKSVADRWMNGWTDGQSGPITRPAFPKATQVTKTELLS